MGSGIEAPRPSNVYKSFTASRKRISFRYSKIWLRGSKVRTSCSIEFTSLPLNSHFLLSSFFDGHFLFQLLWKINSLARYNCHSSTFPLFSPSGSRLTIPYTQFCYCVGPIVPHGLQRFPNFAYYNGSIKSKFRPTQRF